MLSRNGIKLVFSKYNPILAWLPKQPFCRFVLPPCQSRIKRVCSKERPTTWSRLIAWLPQQQLEGTCSKKPAARAFPSSSAFPRVFERLSLPRAPGSRSLLEVAGHCLVSLNPRKLLSTERALFWLSAEIFSFGRCRNIPVKFGLSIKTE